MKKAGEHKLSIFMRYILTCGIILLCAFVITILVFLYYINSATKSYGEKLQTQCRYTSERIAQQIGVLENQCNTPFHLTSANYASEYLTELRNSSTSTANRLAYQRSFQSVASLIHINNSDVYSIYSYNTELDQLIWERRATAYPPVIEKAFWQEKLDDANGATTFLGAKHLSDGSRVFIVGRALRDITGKYPNAHIGYFLITEELSRLQALCSTMLILDSQQYLIADESGIIVSADDDTLIDANLKDLLDSTTYKELFAQTLSEAKIVGESSLLFAAPITGTPWYIVTSVSKTDITNNLYHTAFLALGMILVIFAAISAVAAYLFYASVSTPMNRLIRSIQASGIPLQSAEHTNEIGFLSSSYDQLVDIIEGLQFDNYFALLGRKQLEVELLQAQINPHFLYNTLESIRMMAEIRGDSESAEMTLSLSKILRYSIGSEERISSIREEIAIIEEYVFLQKIRLDNLESVRINIPKDYYDILIPKLTLQPIVENAIIHGLANVQSHGIIDISCAKHAESITISVSDNGEGIQPELLQELNEKLSGAEESSGGGIGIQNVNRRLKLLYGSLCGVRISSTIGVGTTVFIELPLQERSKL